MIELYGLTRHQVELLDVIWHLDTQTEIEEFIQSLEDNDQRECYSLAQLLAIEVMDIVLEGVTEFPAADSVINHIKSL